MVVISGSKQNEDIHLSQVRELLANWKPGETLLASHFLTQHVIIYYDLTVLIPIGVSNSLIVELFLLGYFLLTTNCWSQLCLNCRGFPLVSVFGVTVMDTKSLLYLQEATQVTQVAVKMLEPKAMAWPLLSEIPPPFLEKRGHHHSSSWALAGVICHLCHLSHPRQTVSIFCPCQHASSAKSLTHQTPFSFS